MPAPQMHDRMGGKALNVMALPAPDGWMYYAEVVHSQSGGGARTRAVGPIPYPSAVSALAQGMAYARAVASDDAGDGRHGLGPDAVAATLTWP